jgi:hypothetical protein
MDPFVVLPLTPGGVIVAVACVFAGLPLFARGRRAWRLRRALASLRETPLTEQARGLVRVSGRAVLESPLFGPLSGRPCAGFELAVRGIGSAVGGVVQERRAFRLESGEASALVRPEHADWHLPVTGRRTLERGQAPSERLLALLDSCAELRWLRGRGVALELVERSLEAGHAVSVLGVARVERVLAAAPAGELAATGTDGGGFTAPRLFPGPEVETVELALEADEPLERVQVHADPPGRPLAAPSLGVASLALAGPALALAGLAYLAWAVEPLLARLG